MVKVTVLSKIRFESGSHVPIRLGNGKRLCAKGLGVEGQSCDEESSIGNGGSDHVEFGV